MKNFGRFTINLESTYLEQDEESFKNDLNSTGSIGYMFPHYYDEDDKISSYGGFTVISKNSNIINRIIEVKEIYKIEPTKVLEYEGIYQLIFYFDKGIDLSTYNEYKKTLDILYHGRHIDYHYYPEAPINIEYEGEICANLIGVLSNINFLKNDIKIERTLNKDNLGEYNKSNKLFIEEVIKKYGKLEDLPNVDKDLNIHIERGSPFQYIMFYTDSRIETFKFFNDNFQLNFQEEETDPNKSKDGIIIKESGNKFFSDAHGYYGTDKDNNKVRLTDFFVKVHYRLQKSDKETVFIVSLHNEDGNEHSAKIEWTNTTAKTSFGDYLQKLGNFHYFGMNNIFIQAIHKKITESKAPIIKFLIGYGFHDELGITVFQNGIWNIKEKIFTPKNEGEKYYFDFDGQGYYPTDKNGTSLLDIIGDTTPQLPSTKLVDVNECFDLLGKLYKGDTGPLLLMYTFGMLGYGLFQKKGEFPIFFVRGLTGSGKSTYLEVMQRIFGLRKKNSDFSQTSIFSMGIMMTYLIKFPYFLSEFREGVHDIKGKASMLRSNFDGTGNMKGRADQSVVKYDYAAIPIIDGEEMINDGAVRSRSIQKQFLGGHKIDGNFKEILEEGGEVLDRILYTYLCFADNAKYLKYKKEGFRLFKSPHNRISENFAFIYAGCMCFDENRRDMYIEILNKLLEFQNLDLETNSTAFQIIRLIGKFLDNGYDYESPVTDLPEKKALVISWNKLCEYAGKKKDTGLSLSIDAYKEHLGVMGYPVEHVDDINNRKKRYGPIIPYDNIPKDFLVNELFYMAQYNHDNPDRQIKQTFN